MNVQKILTHVVIQCVLIVVTHMVVFCVHVKWATLEMESTVQVSKTYYTQCGVLCYVALLCLLLLCYL